MNCPYCNNPKTRVVRTISWLDSEKPRIRVCCACGWTFKTVEILDPETNSMVKAMQKAGVLNGKETFSETACLC